jgi:hypothetical protein
MVKRGISGFSYQVWIYSLGLHCTLGMEAAEEEEVGY